MDHPDPMLVQRKIKRVRKRIDNTKPADVELPAYLRDRLAAIRGLPFGVHVASAPDVRTGIDAEKPMPSEPRKRREESVVSPTAPPEPQRKKKEAAPKPEATPGDQPAEQTPQPSETPVREPPVEKPPAEAPTRRDPAPAKEPPREAPPAPIKEPQTPPPATTTP